MGRKKVSYLNDLRRDVAKNLDDLKYCGDTLDSDLFLLTVMVQDDIRTDKNGYHSMSVDHVEKSIAELTKMLEEHKKVVKVYRKYL